VYVCVPHTRRSVMHNNPPGPGTGGRAPGGYPASLLLSRSAVLTKVETDNQQFGRFIADSKSLVRISTSLDLETPDVGKNRLSSESRLLLLRKWGLKRS
jgi:hypothetical protein